MKLFARLLDEATDESGSLSSCLLKARVLASKLGATTLGQWVDAEIGGYTTTPPHYRIVETQAFGSFYGGFGRAVTNYPIPTDGLPDGYREEASTYQFRENVAGLEAMYSTGPDILSYTLDIRIIELLRLVRGPRIGGMTLQYAEARCTKTVIREILLVIRTRLLGFLIELREKDPGLEQESKETSLITGEEANRIAARVIYQGCQFNGAIMSNTSNSISTGGGSISTGSGDLVQARDITHSFNEIAEKTENKEVADKLRQLALSLNEILATLPDDVAQRVGRNAKSFAEEAAGKKPDGEALGSYWEMIQKGLKKTAEASIPVVAPLIAAVIKAAIG